MTFLLGLLLGLAAGSYLTYKFHGTLESWVDFWSDFWKRAK